MAISFNGISIGSGVGLTIIPPPPFPPGLYSWGRNTNGQLGQGDTINRSIPVQIGTLTNWLQTSSGQYHIMAVKTDGTMWSWGKNDNGALGIGDTTNRSSPVQVGALTTWSSISAGSNLSLAIKTDGTMWTWGYNGSYGSLGLGNTTNYSSPKQIGALTNWAKVTSGNGHNIAVKTDGTM